MKYVALVSVGAILIALGALYGVILEWLNELLRFWRQEDEQ